MRSGPPHGVVDDMILRVTAKSYPVALLDVIILNATRVFPRPVKD